METEYNAMGSKQLGGTLKTAKYSSGDRLPGNMKSFIFTAFGKSEDFKNRPKTKFHLSRLVQRPKHKPMKVKYFDPEGSVQYKRDISPQTMEDKFSLYDGPWLSTLRDRSQSCNTAKASRKKSKPLESTVPNPPSFYEEDLQKWDNKFRESVKERKSFKQKYLKDAKVGLEVGPGDKIMQLIQKRRKSRFSTNNFNILDFETKGLNSSSHLVKHGARGSPNKIQLNFECNLRDYRCKTNISHKSQWKNAFQKIHLNSTKNSKSKEHNSSNPRNIIIKLRKMINNRQANANSSLPFFGQGYSKKSNEWTVGLRSYHPDQHSAFRFTDSKFHISNQSPKSHNKIK
ncbi:unnamed protein product [Moneuplotes crassus]|uniref:Uncharacterized protein n=2 Tax=Euplotes crassus TaxID=5936 RepID=A0AAD2CW83_EUPCR|nr:unnamed protein product [Moneuplotes crassus]